MKLILERYHREDEERLQRLGRLGEPPGALAPSQSEPPEPEPSTSATTRAADEAAETETETETETEPRSASTSAADSELSAGMHADGAPAAERAPAAPSEHDAEKDDSPGDHGSSARTDATDKDRKDGGNAYGRGGDDAAAASVEKLLAAAPSLPPPPRAPAAAEPAAAPAEWRPSASLVALVNQKDRAGFTPLLAAANLRPEFFAINGDSRPAPALLLSSGASSSPSSPSSIPSEVCELLLSHGASARVTDDLGSTALHWAAVVGNAEVVRLLAAPHHGCPINHRNEQGDTALHWASRMAHGVVVRALLMCIISPLLVVVKTSNPYAPCHL